MQSEEIIAEECRKKTNQQQSSIHSHTELKDFSLFLKKTDFTMQIPVNLTPTFVSDISKFIYLFICLSYLFDLFFFLIKSFVEMETSL